jgi:hypothetical protein
MPPSAIDLHIEETTGYLHLQMMPSRGGRSRNGDVTKGSLPWQPSESSGMLGGP